MWVSYEPTPAFGCTRSRAPYQVQLLLYFSGKNEIELATSVQVSEHHPYCEQAPRYQSGVRYFPE